MAVSSIPKASTSSAGNFPVASLEKISKGEMMRNVSARSKSTSHLFAETIKTYEAKEEEYLSTIQRMGEMIKNLQMTNEALKKKNLEYSMIHEGKIKEIRRLVSDLSEEGGLAAQTVNEACQQIIHSQDQSRLCCKAHAVIQANKIDRLGEYEGPGISYRADPKEGFSGGPYWLTFLKNKIDPSNKDRIYLPDPASPFEEETRSNTKKIEDTTTHLSQKIQHLEKIL